MQKYSIKEVYMAYVAVKRETCYFSRRISQIFYELNQTESFATFNKIFWK